MTTRIIIVTTCGAVLGASLGLLVVFSNHRQSLRRRGSLWDPEFLRRFNEHYSVHIRRQSER